MSRAYRAAKRGDWNAYQQVVGGNGLAGDVINRGYKIANGVAAEAQEMLQSVVTGVRQALAKDTSLAGKVLSIDEQVAVLSARGKRKQSLRVVTYGKTMERLARDEIMFSPQLDSLFTHVGGAYKPDFVGKGRFANLNFDVTTEAGIEAHLARPGYGPGLQIATYKSAPKNWP